MTLEESVIGLIHDGIGDRGRLEHIITTIQKGNVLYSSDEEYVKKLLEEQQSKSDESKQNEIMNQNTESTKLQSADSEQSEIELLRKEIHKLQDRNHRIEEHLKNSRELSRLWINSFGRGVLGVFLLLFGLGAIFLLAYHLENLDSSMRGMGYGVNPASALIMMLVVFPAILLLIGGTSMYYGIRIISKT